MFGDREGSGPLGGFGPQSGNAGADPGHNHGRSYRGTYRQM